MARVKASGESGYGEYSVSFLLAREFLRRGILPTLHLCLACFWTLVQIVHSIDMTRLIDLPPLWSQLTSRLDTIELQKRFE